MVSELDVCAIKTGEIAWFIYMSAFILLTSAQADLMLSSLRQTLKFIVLVGMQIPLGCMHVQTK